MANSRLSPRASFFAEVDVLSSAEAMPQRVWGQNLSEAGIFLQTTKPFHPGDRLSLRFDISESEVHVRAAEVVWVKPFEPINVDGTLPGVGVRFLSVDPPTRAAIRRYVHKAVPPQDSDVPTPPRPLRSLRLKRNATRLWLRLCRAEILRPFGACPERSRRAAHDDGA